jgi:MFS family permease
VAGYIAARLGRRAPLPTVVVVAAGLGLLGVLLQSAAVPGWFRVLNTAMVVTGVLSGGIIRASITRNRPSESEDPAIRLGG